MDKNSEKQITEKIDGQILEWEEKDQYQIIVDKAKNYLTFVFSGKLKSPKDVPDFIKHNKEAIEAVDDNYFLLADATTESAPGFAMTGLFKEQHKILFSKKIKRAAAVNKKPVHRMVTKVVFKLSGMDAKVFETKEAAEKYLFTEN